jgi:transcription antitermination factor NusG
MTQRWIAVQSSHQAQGRVYNGLQEALGFDSVFCPFERYWQRYRGGERWLTIRPLFLGYTFARAIPEHIGDLQRIDGVSGVLRAEGKPSFVPDAVIDALRRARDGGIFDRTRDCGIPVGTEVMITEGPFAGLIGKIKSATSKHRPRILLHFLGRVTESSIPVDKLERLDA